MLPVRRHLDGEDARQDGTRDADLSAVVKELEESVGSEKQLRDDEIRSGVHLLLEMPEILLVALGLGVTGGVSWRRGHTSANSTASGRDDNLTSGGTQNTPATQMSK